MARRKKDEDEDKEEDKKEETSVEAEDKQEEDVEVEVDLKEDKKDAESDRKARAGEEEIEDKEADAGLSEEELEERREQRRAERKARKERQREREEKKDREIAMLRQQVEQLAQGQAAIERRGFSSDQARVEAGIVEAQQQIEQAREIIKQGIAEQKGEAVVAAQEALFDARSRLDYLNNMRAHMQRATQRPASVDPTIVNHAREWMTKNTWYDSRGRDEDSKIALAIDDVLASEGWDPKSKEYWTEFDKRIAKRLPHRAKAQQRQERDDDDDEEEEGDRGDRRGSPTAGSGRENSGQAGKTTYRLSADRVRAMKEAGMWEQFQTDAKFKSRMLARFREQDQVLKARR